MATPFSRTIRSLAHDTSQFALFIWGLVALLFGAWFSWFTLGHVTLYEVSQSSRVEVEQAAHTVTTSLAGKVVATSMKLGKSVEAGESLMELDARIERLRLQEEEARLAAIPPQLAALTRQLEDGAHAVEREQVATMSSLQHAQARHHEALAAASFANDHVQRMAQLLRAQMIPEVDFLRAKVDAEKTQASAEAFSHEITRLTAEASGKRHDKHATLEALRREVAALGGQRELSLATIARLNQDIEKHVIRAPVSGVLGEVAALHPGAFVETGGVVGSIIPQGDLRIVAEFSPARVLGRMHPGQMARVRLDGYSWVQYGSLAATVTRVASEIRAGKVRVELAPTTQTPLALPLQHGLPGTVEVEVDHITPLTLTLRTVGQLLTNPAQPSHLKTESSS